VVDAPELPLSPELVLVAPELGEHALVKVPNGRPPPAAAQLPVLPAQVPPAPPAQAPPAPPEPPADVAASPALPEPAAQAEAVSVPPEPPAGWRLTVGGAVVIALCVFVVFGAGFLIGNSVLSGSSTPSLEPVAQNVSSAPAPRVATPRPPSRAPGTAVVATTPVPTQQANPKPKPASTAASTPPPQPKPTPTPKPASTAASTPSPEPKPKPTPKTVRPIPGGGYVLPGGRFQVSSSGTTIVDFTLQSTCVGPLTLPSIPIAPTGGFAFAGHPAGSSSATVRVRGTFSSPTEARGTTHVIGAGCSAPATSFAARLS
jgi:hypothetical protein